MRRPPDPDAPKDKAPDDEQPAHGGRARKRVDLFNRQRGISTDGEPEEEKGGGGTEQKKPADPNDKPR
jgi:hypothetical protein